MNGKFLISGTTDGKTWSPLNSETPEALEKEGAFAASGSCLFTLGTNRVWMGTGGFTARVFYSDDRGKTWNVSTTPLAKSNETSGVFSLSFFDDKTGIAVGGDYKKEKDSLNSIALTTDGGKTWRSNSGKLPNGFRSAVTWINSTSLIAAGPSGTDFSMDSGENWKNIDTVGFHALNKSPDGKTIWAVGENGCIGKLDMNWVIKTVNKKP